MGPVPSPKGAPLSACKRKQKQYENFMKKNTLNTEFILFNNIRDILLTCLYLVSDKFDIKLKNSVTQLAKCNMHRKDDVCGNRKAIILVDSVSLNRCSKIK